ncbi:DNA processing protein DprA [Candidatus Nanosynbacter lyticus]|uniref:DNA processing protein DprA n=1 Tax=Candidatus Nanosynbacter lyticus TaxID=2093824 RepID=A0A6S4GSW4_9BACT|nr:DNA-processing protein DprA [Candidatus Nanosynbacter lyticus]AJA06391.1 DNA processing protein DprA [Candidatus Nanosynbacter lyticus]QCT41406.1 DNA-protecting protein DprA [TM7 phylum sp. oral taxon 952]
MEIKRILPDKHIFTQRLAHIANPPKSLCYMGKLPEANAPIVSIVGSRKPSAYGKEVTERLAAELASAGCIIVSGLALGVDGIAQKAALEAGGTVVAVVPNELPDISPRTNYKLAMDIIRQGGAVISEWMKGDNKIVNRWSFLERNRLVSGLADGIIITEATERSGTLNTASHALNQGRDLFVVPGNITSPLSAGCNNLLKQGAYLVTDANDILNIIAPEKLQKSSSPEAPLSSTPEEAIIIKLISSGIRDGDELQQNSGLSASDFATALTMLEINGAIKPLGANNWTLR